MSSATDHRHIVTALPAQLPLPCAQPFGLIGTLAVEDGDGMRTRRERAHRGGHWCWPTHRPVKPGHQRISPGICWPPCRVLHETHPVQDKASPRARLAWWRAGQGGHSGRVVRSDGARATSTVDGTAAKDSVAVAGSVATVGSVGVAGSVATVGSVGVAGSAATAGSVGVAGSAATAGSIGVRGSVVTMFSAGITACIGCLACVGCRRCIGCLGCIDCVDCIGCIGCIGLRGAVGQRGVRA
jgi:hypothetical protein